MSLEFRFEHVDFIYVIFRAIKVRILIEVVSKRLITSIRRIEWEMKGNQDKTLKNSNTEHSLEKNKQSEQVWKTKPMWFY